MTLTARAPAPRAFPRTKFRPAAPSQTVVARPALLARLDAGQPVGLTAVVASPGSGKTQLLATWAASRPDGSLAWLTCDEHDADPVRFWTALTRAVRTVSPRFGADVIALLEVDGRVTADAVGSFVNEVARLPEGFALVVDDLHHCTRAHGWVSDLVSGWPGNAQLVASSRTDAPLPLHRLRVGGRVLELRNQDLQFSLEDAARLFGNFGLHLAPADLARMYVETEGWVTALQMAALSLRAAADPGAAAGAVHLGGRAIADYFVTEVLATQPAGLARFMLESSVLEELTEDACNAVTGREDALSKLRDLERRNLFLEVLDGAGTVFRYHRLVRETLRAEFRATDSTGWVALHHRAATWFADQGDTRAALGHLVAAGDADAACRLLWETAVDDYLHDPRHLQPVDLRPAGRAVLVARAPEQLLALATDLLLRGHWHEGGDYLDMIDPGSPAIPPGSVLAARLDATRSVRALLAGELEVAIGHGLAARTAAERAEVPDDPWLSALPMVLERAYSLLGDFPAAEQELARQSAVQALPPPIARVQLPGARAYAWYEQGHIRRAERLARLTEEEAERRGLGRHFVAVEHLRTLAGVAFERRDFGSAERHLEQALSISEQGRPPWEFLCLLDRADLWFVQGSAEDAFANLAAARCVLPAASPALVARADEREAVLRLRLGELGHAWALAGRLPPVPRAFLLARIALAEADPEVALRHLDDAAGPDDTAWRALTRQILCATAALQLGGAGATELVAGVIRLAEREGFVHSVVTPTPELTAALAGMPDGVPRSAFVEGLIAAARDCATPLAGVVSGRRLPDPLTGRELEVLRLLPSGLTYVQLSARLAVSRNTVKSHLKSVYMKLGVSTRAEAIARAAGLGYL